MEEAKHARCATSTRGCVHERAQLHECRVASTRAQVHERKCARERCATSTRAQVHKRPSAPRVRCSYVRACLCVVLACVIAFQVPFVSDVFAANQSSTDESSFQGLSGESSETKDAAIDGAAASDGVLTGEQNSSQSHSIDNASASAIDANDTVASSTAQNTSDTQVAQSGQSASNLQGSQNDESVQATQDAQGAHDARGGSDAQSAQSVQEPQSTQNTLAVGSKFVAENDDGIAITYTVLSSSTVRVGPDPTSQYGTPDPAISVNTKGALNIPESVEDSSGITYSVTAIGDCAFRNCARITSVTIPDSVYSLGNYIFQDCAKLTSVTFSGSSTITKIPNGTFEGCTKLVDLTLPSGINDIGSAAFADCKALSSFVIPEGAVMVRSSCFSGSGITSIVIPSTVQTIDNAAFSGTKLSDVVIPSSVKKVNSSAFANCASLKTVTFATGCQVIDISYNCFKGCTSLTSVNFSSLVRNILSGAFEECSSLKSVVFPASIRKISDTAFQRCSQLTTLYFQGNASAVTSTDSSFYMCPKLNTVVFLDKKSPGLIFTSSEPTYYYSVIYKHPGAQTEYGRVIVKEKSIINSLSQSDILSGSVPAEPSGYTWIYESTDTPTQPLTDTTVVTSKRQSGELVVGDVFYADTIEGVTVAYTVTSDSKSATPSVQVGINTISSEWKSAADAQTGGCVTIPEEVVGDDAVTYKVTSIAPRAFSSCNRIYSLVLPAGLTKLGMGVFSASSILNNITFKGDMSAVSDNGAFDYCSKIKRVIYEDKKGSISFGYSDPAIYYTVSYYSSKTSWQYKEGVSKVVVHEGAKLFGLDETEVYSGTQPSLNEGCKWFFEEGFSGDVALEDSCWVYQDYDGFRYQVTLKQDASKSQKIPCWFKVLTKAEGSNRGTVQVGVSSPKEQAVSTSAVGTLVIPSVVYDEEGNAYNVVSVGDYAFGSPDYFYACSNLIGIELPQSVTSFGSYAFANCSFLGSVTIPYGLTDMGASCFSRCSALIDASLHIATKLTYIPENAFYGCESLPGIYIPRSVTSIAKGAFAGCAQITEMVFFGDVDEIDLAQGSLSTGSGDTCEALVFMGRKWTSSQGGKSGFAMRETARTFYHVKCYSDYDTYMSDGHYSSVLLDSAVPLASATSADLYYGKVVSTDPIPTLSEWQSWKMMDGRSATQTLTNSTSAVILPDVSYAQITWLNPDEGSDIYHSTSRRIEPSFTLSMPDATLLTQDVDFYIDRTRGVNGFANNLGVGTATMYIAGEGCYTGETRFYFTIASSGNPTNMTVTFLEDTTHTYDGLPYDPQVEVKNPNNNKVLVEGTDYTLRYINDNKAGRARVVVTGKGYFYAGTTAWREYVILPADISSATVSGLDEVYAYTGSEVTPSFTLKGALGRTLRSGTDYTLSYANNTDIGEATITINGMGNYTGTLTLHFAIERGGGGGGRGNGESAGVGGAGTQVSAGRADGGDQSGSGSDSGYSMVSRTTQASLSEEVANAQSASGGASSEGSADGAAGARVFEIGRVLAEVESSSDAVTIPLFIIIAGFIVYGACRRYRQYRKQI